MSVKPPSMRCPMCGELTEHASVPHENFGDDPFSPSMLLSDLFGYQPQRIGRDRNYVITTPVGDIHFFERLRKCSNCDHCFKSAEVEEHVLNMLQLRVAELEAKNSELEAVIAKVKAAVTDVKSETKKSSSISDRRKRRRRTANATA